MDGASAALLEATAALQDLACAEAADRWVAEGKRE